MDKFDYDLIPTNIKTEIDRYVSKKIPTNGFLLAVLSNDLSLCIGNADEENIKALPQIVSYIYNEIPRSCYGSLEIVTRYLRS